MESEQRCISHKCEKCNSELYKYTTKDKIITTSIMFVVMFIVFGGIIALDNLTAQPSGCYERHYISGRGTDVEIIKNVDTDCPN